MIQTTKKLSIMRLHRTAFPQVILIFASIFLHVYAFSGTSLAYQQKIIPITVLSGFLGSGKTTLLQHLLNNSEGIKIAVIVNDVAEINIDNKLIVGNTAAASGASGKSEKPAGIVELSNGCACCSLADELLPSVSELITLSDMRCQAAKDDDGYDGFDHIVIELSGVASPKSIRANFQDAEYYGMPLMERVRLDTMVTVVDCSTYLDYLRDANGNLVDEDESPDLFFRSEEERQQKKLDEEEDRWLALERTHTSTTVSQLLVEQTEISDVVLLNKVDILDSEQDSSIDDSSLSTLADIESVVAALNTRAKVFQTKFGVVKIKDILGAAQGLGVVDAGITDDHRDAIEALTSLEDEESKSGPITDDGHSHSHSHSHGHSHDAAEATCSDPNCTDDSHDHSHSHSHAAGEEIETVCNDPNCADTSHDHSHTHSHSHSHSPHDSATPDGIGTYIFRARRPFHPKRLTNALRMMPVVRGLPDNDGHLHRHDGFSDEQQNVFQRILRSKGFCWLADSHVAAMYWSHAGSSFEMQCLGRWWATLPQDQWPEEARGDILADFDNHNHDEEAYTFESVGDRRQEVVLIGPGLGTVEARNYIEQTLKKCLLNDEEYAEYQSLVADESGLKEVFASPLPINMLTY